MDNKAVSLTSSLNISGDTPYETRVKLIDEFKRGERRIMISKPKILGFGLNLQIATRQVFSGLQDSYEQFYQAVRRCWRFGQQRPVHVHVALADTEEAIWRAVRRKQADHEDMKIHMYAAMKRAVEVRGVKNNYRPTQIAQLPQWMEAS